MKVEGRTVLPVPHTSRSLYFIYSVALAKLMKIINCAAIFEIIGRIIPAFNSLDFLIPYFALEKLYVEH